MYNRQLVFFFFLLSWVFALCMLFLFCRGAELHPALTILFLAPYLISAGLDQFHAISGAKDIKIKCLLWHSLLVIDISSCNKAGSRQVQGRKHRHATVTKGVLRLLIWKQGVIRNGQDRYDIHNNARKIGHETKERSCSS